MKTRRPASMGSNGEMPAGDRKKPVERELTTTAGGAPKEASGRWKAPLVWAEIDLQAIAHNVRALRRIARPQAQLMAVVKADGYGHGALKVAQTALKAGARWLGVARIDEAVALRTAGIDAPILIFGHTPWERAADLVAHDLRQAVYDLQNARAYAAAAARMGGRITVHLKIDTGMGRLGLVADEGGAPSPGNTAADAVLEAASAIMAMRSLSVEGIFTHFSTADSRDKRYTLRQLQLFESCVTRLRRAGYEFAVRHAANSAALIDVPAAHLDLVRPGIALYGLHPSDETDRSRATLVPAMTLKARVVHLKRVPAGFNISYGNTYRTPRPTVIATVPVGYADGFSRRLSSRGNMLVGGRRAPVVGRVCMDHAMLDVGGIPDVAPADEVVVFGTQGEASLPADEVAAQLDTIAYEVVTGVTARVPRVYLPATPAIRPMPHPLDEDPRIGGPEDPRGRGVK
jgi:alanine racemase